MDEQVLKAEAPAAPAFIGVIQHEFANCVVDGREDVVHDIEPQHVPRRWSKFFIFSRITR